MTRWHRSRSSRRATKPTSPERDGIWRPWLVLIALLPLTVIAAPWTVRDGNGAAGTLPQAQTLSTGGDELTLFRDPAGGVHLRFTSAAAFGILSPKSCPTFQIDQRQPAHHYTLETTCHVEQQHALIDVGQVHNHALESLAVDQMMNGGQLAFRFLTAAGAYREALFPLTHSATAIKRALGTSVRVRAPQ